MTPTGSRGVLAPAKVNLSLHVTGRRDDGYHLLDSLVAFAETGDRLDLVPGGPLSIHVSGPFADGVPCDDRNLLWRAADRAGWTGAIHLEKNLPHPAGLGGGSSDAAAFLNAVAAHIEPEAQCALGADVPVCMHAAAARMQGIGERVTPVNLPPLPAVLVNPGVDVPTGQVFAALSRRDNPPMPHDIPGFSDAADCAAWLSAQRNDLETPARQVAPQINSVLDLLHETRDALLVRMSGSGASCFALYPTLKAAHFAVYEIGAAQPDWWCVATELR